MEDLKEKARNYFVLGMIAKVLGMRSESAANFFKSLFAVDDFVLYALIKDKPSNHNERFAMLKRNAPELYNITDRLFSTYRRTYTQELSKEEIELVKNRIVDAFKNAKITTPTNEEIEGKLKEFAKKGKHFD